jgi:hypothetical protein
MLDCVERLLAHSDELVLVDRNFDPRKPRFAKPFEAFTSVRPGWRRLELHTALPSGFDADRQEAAYRRALELAVPERTTLTVCFWPGLEGGERLHPRFVLTDRGGVQFDYGLDEGESQADTTLVTLLEHEVFLGLWADYRPGAKKFGQARTVQAVGRG